MAIQPEDERKPCFYCHILLAPAEERVWFEGKPYHEHCNKKRERKVRLRAFLSANRGQVFLDIHPHHIKGGPFDP